MNRTFALIAKRHLVSCVTTRGIWSFIPKIDHINVNYVPVVLNGKTIYGITFEGDTENRLHLAATR